MNGYGEFSYDAIFSVTRNLLIHSGFADSDRDIGEDTLLAEHLGMTEMDKARLAYTLIFNSCYDISIGDDEITGWKKVRNVVATVFKKELVFVMSRRARGMPIAVYPYCPLKWDGLFSLEEVIEARQKCGLPPTI